MIIWFVCYTTVIRYGTNRHFMNPREPL